MYSDIVLDAKEYVSKKLIGLENKGYKFHNLNHTLDVFSRATYLGIKEGINEDSLEILQLSALFHDMGFLKQYDNNEVIGAEIAKKWLLDNNYSEDKIDIVKKVILATIPSFDGPEGILCKIIKDADLDNLGRDDFEEKFYTLKKELKNIKGNNFDENIFLELTKKFVLGYKFYTKTQIEERGKKLEENKKKVLKFE